MWDYFLERKVLFIAIFAIVGFMVFAVIRRPDVADPVVSAFTTVNMDSPMTLGNRDAKVSVIQYSDFICPSCSYFSTQIMPTIEREFIDTGIVKFEFRPMAFIADGSVQAGEGAFCAIEQNKFWDYHDAIYNVVVDKTLRQNLDPKSEVILTKDSVEQIASSVGVDADSFGTCMSSQTHLSDIKNATSTAQRNGVTGTPYIMVNGQKYTGNITLDAFRAFIKAQS